MKIQLSTDKSYPSSDHDQLSNNSSYHDELFKVECELNFWKDLNSMQLGKDTLVTNWKTKTILLNKLSEICSNTAYPWSTVNAL